MKNKVTSMILATGVALALSVGTLSASTVQNTIQSSNFVLGPTTPGKWGSPVMGTGATVTYSFMGAGLETFEGAATSIDLNSFLPGGFQAQVANAFNAWSAIADITFNLVADPGVGWQSPGAMASDIRIGGAVVDGPSNTLAYAFFPPSNGGAAAGDVIFDSQENWTIGNAGIDVFTVVAHEIGHAIGLGHTNVPGSLMNPFYAYTPTGPQADDIAGAQFIYGSPTLSPVPIPASLPLLAAGFALIGFVGRRKTRKAA